MGLFGKLFEKKVCDICGDEIKLLGNKKLSDANMCKNCAAKLSPWFTGRRKTALEDIKEQLAYRMENQNVVNAFRVTRTLNTGTTYKVLIDESTQKFIVTNMSNFKESNPDVIDLEQLTGCVVDVHESKSEIYMKDKEGKNVSYDPRRYKYSYDFYIIMNINHPFFDEIKFKINNSSVVINPYEGRPIHQPARTGVAGAITNGIAAALSDNRHSMYSPEYERYSNMGNEIVQTLMGLKGTNVNEVVYTTTSASAAAPVEVTCPWCSAVTRKTETGHCEFCGGNLE